MKNIAVLFLLLLTTLITSCYCQWTTLGYVPGYLEAVKFFNESTGIAAGEHGIWRTTTGGASWIQVLSTGLWLDGLHFIDSVNGYAVGDSVTFKTSNGGINWSQYNLSGSYGLRAISFFSATTGILVGSPGIYRTTDAGQNWYLSFSGIDKRGTYCLSNGIGYVVGLGGGGPETVLKTTNSGLNWQTRLGGLVRLNGVWAVTSELVFICGDRGRIRRTTDGGVNWIILDSLTPRNLRAITFADANTGTIVGDYGVILRTTNSGNNWTIQPSGTSNHLHGVSFINPNTGWAVGTQGVVLRTTNGGITPVEPIAGEIPDGFKLEQNYPNPFNSKSKIKYQISKLGEVKLAVLDVLGKEIDVLVNKELQPGTYEAEWSAENFPSGIYFYRLTIGDFSITRKTVLLK